MSRMERVWKMFEGGGESGMKPFLGDQQYDPRPLADYLYKRQQFDPNSIEASPGRMRRPTYEELREEGRNEIRAEWDKSVRDLRARWQDEARAWRNERFVYWGIVAALVLLLWTK